MTVSLFGYLLMYNFEQFLKLSLTTIVLKTGPDQPVQPVQPGTGH